MADQRRSVRRLFFCVRMLLVLSLSLPQCTGLQPAAWFGAPASHNFERTQPAACVHASVGGAFDTPPIFEARRGEGVCLHNDTKFPSLALATNPVLIASVDHPLTATAHVLPVPPACRVSAGCDGVALSDLLHVPNRLEPL